MPVPALVMPNPVPLMTPPTVRSPPLTVTVRVALSVTAPVPRLRSLVPVKVKLLFQFCALLFVSVIAPPLVLLMVAAPEMVKAPVPRAVALLMLSVPVELKVVMPP